MSGQYEGPDPQAPWGAPPPAASQPEPRQPETGTAGTLGTAGTAGAGTTPRWSWRKSLVAVLVALGITAGGGVAVYAASGSAGADANGGPGAPGSGYGQPGGPGVRPPLDGPMDGGRMGALLGALHGEFVVAENGGYVTKLMQVGELTETTDDSVTVRSEDGFTQTYRLETDTAGTDDTDDTMKADVQSGDTVRVVATRSGDTVTADFVTDGSWPTPPTR